MKSNLTEIIEKINGFKIPEKNCKVLAIKFINLIFTLNDYLPLPNDCEVSNYGGIQFYFKSLNLTIVISKYINVKEYHFTFNYNKNIDDINAAMLELQKIKIKNEFNEYVE